MKIIKKLILGIAIFMFTMTNIYASCNITKATVTAPNKIDENDSLATEIAEEGTVLLKNDYNVLPLTTDENIGGLGIAQDAQQVFGGGGSGWVNSNLTITYLKGLSYAASRGKIKSYTPMANANMSGDFNKVIYFISRGTTEGEDRKASSFNLDTVEKYDISSLIMRFGKENVIVVLNVGSVIDTSWLISKDVAAIVLAYYGGEQAGTALSSVLTGKTVPSGKTVDTWAKAYADYPSSDESGIGTFAGNKNTYYTEDIYVGYRYFSTFDANYAKVNYEFGYGLSYTSFVISDVNIEIKNRVVNVAATIKNTGTYSGKEVFQVYFGAPKGLLGAPNMELCGFVKTKLLEPNEIEIVNAEFSIEEFARYDDMGYICNNSWVIEKGDYCIYAGNSIKNAQENGIRYTYTQKDNSVLETTSELRPTMLPKKLLSDGTYATLWNGGSEDKTYTVPKAGSVVIQAEDFSASQGSSTVEAYYVGNDKGFGVGNLNSAGKSLTYTLNVEKTGTYYIAFNIASAWDNQNDMFELYIDGINQNVNASMNKTHSDSDGKWYQCAYLKGGYSINFQKTGTVKLMFVGNSTYFMNFDSFVIYNNIISADSQTEIQAQNANASSLGTVAYADGNSTAPSNDAGNYFTYNLNVEQSGDYNLDFVMSNITTASADCMDIFINEVKQNNVSVSLKRTAANGDDIIVSNNYTFTNTDTATITLPEGSVVLKFATKDASVCSIDKFMLSPVSLNKKTTGSYENNTDDFSYYADTSGTAFDKLLTYDDVYADYSKLDDFVNQLSVEELSYLLGLDSTQNNIGTGTGGIGGMNIDSKYKIPSVYTSDGPAGIRYSNSSLYSTWFPCMTMLASTWNTELAYEFGEAVASEALLGGVNVWLAPGVNIHRNPLCGRNFEYFSEDPLIAGMFGSQVTLGAQSTGVSVSVKHFAVNNQETNRFSNNSCVSTRALREIYLKAFEIIVKNASPNSIMSSYNMVNGEYAASSCDLITSVLRDDWGFNGVVFSDWTGFMNHISLVKSGNTFKSFNPQYSELVQAFKSGILSREELEENVKDVIKFIIKSNANRQTVNKIGTETEKIISASYAFKYVTEDGTNVYYRLSIEKSGYYTFTVSENSYGLNYTIDRNDNFSKNGFMVYLDAGMHELTIKTEAQNIDEVSLSDIGIGYEETNPLDTPSDNPSENNNSGKPAENKLSAGAVVAITVSAIAVIGCGTAVAFVIQKRKKQKKS